MQKILVVLAVLANLVLANDHPLTSVYNEWREKYCNYIQKHNLEPSFDLFKQNYEIIEKHNKNLNKTYTLEINQFAGVPFLNGQTEVKNEILKSIRSYKTRSCNFGECMDLCNVLSSSACDYLCSNINNTDCVNICDNATFDLCSVACAHTCQEDTSSSCEDTSSSCEECSDDCEDTSSSCEECSDDCDDKCDYSDDNDCLGTCISDNCPHCVYNLSSFEQKLPDYLNYNELGYMTPVRDQGQCGSCFAVSAVEAIESSYYKKMNKTVLLSVQEVVSCDTKDLGCNGGLMDNVFDWAHENGGLCKDSDYSYVSGHSHISEACLLNCSVVDNSRPSHIIDIEHDEEALKTALVNLGPLSVAIEADQDTFRFYKSGVISGPCGAHLNHGVLLVGYGHDNETGLDYWLLKNSWSSDWGENGYARIERNKKTWANLGECGISSSASYPVL